MEFLEFPLPIADVRAASGLAAARDRPAPVHHHNELRGLEDCRIARLQDCRIAGTELGFMWIGLISNYL